MGVQVWENQGSEQYSGKDKTLGKQGKNNMKGSNFIRNTEKGKGNIKLGKG